MVKRVRRSSLAISAAAVLYSVVVPVWACGCNGSSEAPRTAEPEGSSDGAGATGGTLGGAANAGGSPSIVIVEGCGSPTCATTYCGPDCCDGRYPGAYCGDPQSVQGMPATNQMSEPDSGDASGTLAPDGSVAESAVDAGSSSNLEEGCVWVGYGIGAPPNQQLESGEGHLSVHSFQACIDLRGVPGNQLEVVEGGDEARMECCSDGAALGPPRDGGVSLVDSVIEASGGGAERQTLVEEAATICADLGQDLGDWIAVYATDGVRVDRFYFGCI